MVYLLLVAVHFCYGFCWRGTERIPEDEDVVVRGAAEAFDDLVTNGSSFPEPLFRFGETLVCI